MSTNDPGTSAPGKGQHHKTHEPIVQSGSESTRVLREQAQRRREAEEKLRHHLREAKERPAGH